MILVRHGTFVTTPFEGAVDFCRSGGPDRYEGSDPAAPDAPSSRSQEYGLALQHLFDAGPAALATEAPALVAAEGHKWRDDAGAIDEDRAAFQLFGEALDPYRIVDVEIGAESVAVVIGLRQYVVVVGEVEKRLDWSEHLLLSQVT
jgi:hypothetical protein